MMVSSSRCLSSGIIVHTITGRVELVNRPLLSPGNASQRILLDPETSLALATLSIAEHYLVNSRVVLSRQSSEAMRRIAPPPERNGGQEIDRDCSTGLHTYNRPPNAAKDENIKRKRKRKAESQPDSNSNALFWFEARKQQPSRKSDAPAMSRSIPFPTHHHTHPAHTQSR